MNLNTSTMVSIANGVGELEFPHALKRDLLMSTIQCQSLYIDANPAAKNEGFFIVCDCSYYITQNGMAKKNILAMFQNKKSVNIVYFPTHRVPITTPQDRLKIEIVNGAGDCQKGSALAVFDIDGCVSNKLLAI